MKDCFEFWVSAVCEVSEVTVAEDLCTAKLPKCSHSQMQQILLADYLLPGYAYFM